MWQIVVDGEVFSPFHQPKLATWISCDTRLILKKIDKWVIMTMRGISGKSNFEKTLKPNSLMQNI